VVVDVEVVWVVEVDEDVVDVVLVLEFVVTVSVLVWVSDEAVTGVVEDVVLEGFDAAVPSGVPDSSSVAWEPY